MRAATFEAHPLCRASARGRVCWRIPAAYRGRCDEDVRRRLCSPRTSSSTSCDPRDRGRRRLEMRRASFRDGDATVRMEGYIDLNKALVDSTWQMGVSSSRRMKWPPSRSCWRGRCGSLAPGPGRSRRMTSSAAPACPQDEGDISRLESLNRPAVPRPPRLQRRRAQPSG